jgi:membrane glycosyltransferase
MFAPMPVQELNRWKAATRVCRATHRWAAGARRAVVFTATLGLTAAASYEMYRVLNVTGMTMLHIALLIVFIITLPGSRCHS